MFYYLVFVAKLQLNLDFFTIFIFNERLVNFSNEINTVACKIRNNFMAYLQKMAIEMMQNSTKSQPRSFICSLWKSYSSIISLLNVNASAFCMWFCTMTYKIAGKVSDGIELKLLWKKWTKLYERRRKNKWERVMNHKSFILSLLLVLEAREYESKSKMTCINLTVITAGSQRSLFNTINNTITFDWCC